MACTGRATVLDQERRFIYTVPDIGLGGERISGGGERGGAERGRGSEGVRPGVEPVHMGRDFGKLVLQNQDNQPDDINILINAGRSVAPACQQLLSPSTLSLPCSCAMHPPS